MSTGYYVTIVRGEKRGWLLGPYDDRSTAEDMVRVARDAAYDINPFTHFDAFGVSRLDAKSLPPGTLNKYVEQRL